MLAIQEYLQNSSLDTLNEDLAIKATRHESLPLVVLNYSQLESPKIHPVIRDCRGIVIQTDSPIFPVISQGFRRFFNWGEYIEEMNQFDWSDFSVNEKCDGTYIGLAYFQDQWILHTRGGWGNNIVGKSPFTWENLFCIAMGIKNLQEIPFPRDSSYVFELCSVYNKVVRTYPTPMTFLIGARFNALIEYSPSQLDQFARQYQLNSPIRYSFSSIDEIISLIKQYERDDPTYEGVVIRDIDNIRFKIKSLTYLALHRMKGEDNSFNFKGVLPFILAGDTDELLVYFPEVEELTKSMAEKIRVVWSEIVDLWNNSKDEISQKDFALKVKDHQFSGLLFTNRKQNGDLESLQNLWRNSPDMMLKILFK
ncbi:MAG: RNA ligase, T4 RnlA-like protein [Candidatus Woesebacteria bacterium GW2011_GWB1_39_12]|uniref:RNA ligase, T4 RnlA-like protein n=1 Tax=Candidatus Woesebacteria bacterium GW2011_GWB1_39_12 TaxID=1618574 RepID=A0A0G0QET5_9BACT|nr:MAG: RNA ligase, T4 RnlA-like protein [Candidatus Woesebacteria bacterium GW2011_GWB1_39_12]